MAINGNYLGLYINGQRIALTKTNDFSQKRSFDDITTKDSSGSKEVLPTMLEANCSMEGIFTSNLQNKLQWPENFNNAVWSKGGATISGTKIEAPNGQLLGQVLTWNASSNINQTVDNFDFTPFIGETIIVSLYVKGSGSIELQVGDDADNNDSGIITLTIDWQRITASYVLDSGVDIYLQLNKVSGTAVSLAFPQLEIGTIATNYKGSQETFKDLVTISEARQKVTILQTTNFDDDLTITYEGYITDLAIKAEHDKANTFTCNFESTSSITNSIV